MIDPANRRARRLAQAKTRKQRGAKAPRNQGLSAALAFERAGRLREAFDAYCALTAAGADATVCRHFGHFLVACTPARPHPDIDAALLAALADSWVRPDLLAQPVARYLDAKWRGAMAVPIVPDPVAMLRHPAAAGLLADPLLLALLRATPAATPALDIFLARARHAALVAASDGQPVAALLPFLAALGERAAANGFALTLPATPDERPLRDAEAMLLEGLRDQAAAPAITALKACFAPLQDRPVDHPPLADLVAAQIEFPRERARIAAALMPATPMPEETAIVRAQYEAHPYPLWVREPSGVPIAVPEAVKRQLGTPPRRVLVAGCGTGQHALGAADRWSKAGVLAIDCSRTSLAHAILKLRERGLTRVQFALGDLLHAEALGESFDVIEAVGVLHHLASPVKGLEALLRVLNPGGAILIGLYARAARRHLAAARALADRPQPRSDAELRAFRSRALAEGVAPEILYSPDFYSLGGCRDLIFHEREHSFDLAELASLLGEAGLSLLAIETPPAVRGRIGLPGESDLAGWGRMEDEQPLLFGNMYHVWAARNTGG
jgi:SAM-dependent methyltransferase